MINLTNRNNTLYIDYMEFGKRVRRSLKIQDTKANRNYAVRNIIPEIERKLLSGINTQLNLKLSHFTDLVLKEQEKENTIYLYKIFIKRVFEYIDDRDIDKYSVLDFDKAIGRMRDNGLSDKSITAYIAPFKKAFNLAIQRDVVDKNPIKTKLKPKSKKKSAYDIFQVAQILRESAKNKELEMFLYLAFYTGARAGEILCLQWGDIGKDNILISKTWNCNLSIYNSPKNGESREVVILNPLRKFLNTKERGSDSEFIFKSRNQTKYRTGLKEILTKLGYKVQTLHATRHTYISILFSQNTDPMLIQKQVGQKSTSMLDIYTHYIPKNGDKERLNLAFDTILAQS